MPHNILEYDLVDGFIHNWLVAGPLWTAEPLAEFPSPPAQAPLERDSFEVSGQSLAWAYYRCLQDHLVDIAPLQAGDGCANAWAAVQLRAPVASSARLTVFAPAALQVWLNGELLQPVADPDLPSRPVGHAAWSCDAPLQQENALFIRFEAVPGQHAIAARVEGLAGQASASPEALQKLVVCVPTRAMFPHRHMIFEQLFDHAYLESFAHYKGNLVNIRWGEEAEMSTSYSYKVRDELRQIYVEGNAEVKLEPYDAGHPQRIWERPYHIALQAPGREYWEQDLRYERLLPFYILDTAYASAPQETFFQRRKLALEHASRRETHLFAEIAKMAAETWEKVSVDHILAAVERLQNPHADRCLLLVGLLGMLRRYQDHEKFPKEVVQPLTECALAFDYHPPDADGQVILAHAAAVLAGGLYPQGSFLKHGLTGVALCQQAETAARDWIRSQGAQGLTAWTSPLEIERFVVALTHLTSLAEEDALRDLAAVLLDKILFLLAAVSHQGVFGAAHHSLSAGAVQSAQLQAASGITRLLFGVGVYNAHIAGPVSLACSNYEFPSFLSNIALEPAAEMLHKERQVNSRGERVNLVAYRTPDTLLSSVQDYRPGQAGQAEQVWQATLSADAIVYTNHPAAMGQQEGRQPGFWLGNGSLPRLAQWKDSLVAVYNLPEGDWMGFTHAYFPTIAFDEHVFARGWAFARVGEGFLGLTCSQGFELVRHGPGAMRELRSFGRQNVWLCVTGRRAVYRGFRKFQKRCMAIKPQWRDLGVAFQNLWGEAIDFGWEGAFSVNGEPQSLSDFKHIENAYCAVEPGATHMDIHSGETLLRLNFQ
jgi:hypothetical protein